MSYGVIRIEHLGGSANNTKITDAETGKPIEMVTELDIHVQAQDMPTIRLTFCEAFFVWQGKPELITPLQAVVGEIRQFAVHNSFPDSPAVSTRELIDWADRIEQQIAAATNLTWEPKV